MKTTFRQVIQYDKKLGHKFVPNQTACFKYGNGTYLIETDENGFRNKKNKAEIGKLKIVCLGDSFTAGDGVSNHHRFTDLLEQMYDCEIINLAVSGYGIDQQVLAYEEYGKDIEHDLVLFTPFIEDINRNLLSAREGIDRVTGKIVEIPKPYFVLENDALTLKNQPVPKKRKETNGQILGSGNISSHSKSKARIIAYRIKKTVTNFPKEAKRWIRINVLNKTSYPQTEDINSAAWKITKPIINRLKKLSNGKQLIIFPLPSMKMVQRGETSKHYINAFKTLEDDNTRVFDLYHALKKEHRPKQETVFLNICWHFSQSGHQLVAHEIGSVLKLNYGVSSKKSITAEDAKVRVLGISCFYHDSAACIIEDGKVIAAAQEERFTRVKHDKSFPLNAINYCLEACKIDINALTRIVYYDYETWTIERVLHNAFEIGEKREQFWNDAKKSLSKKLFLPKIIRNRTGYRGEIEKCQHHVSHAAGAYYPSPFKDAAILVIDGVGEWACTTIAKGSGNNIEILQQQYYPHSIGLLYSAFTYYTGFKVNSGEYKLMGLAPYGKPVYRELILDKIVEVKEDGSIHLNMEYFSFQEGERMVNERFEALFGGPARQEEEKITKREMDLAASIQAVLEEIVIKLANHAKRITGSDYLVMSGGVALNCVANGKLYDFTAFKDFYFQPASGDAGGAMGCALAWYFQNHPNVEKQITEHESAYLGPEFSEDEILAFIDSKDYPYEKVDYAKRAEIIAKLLSEKLIIGYFDGRMEFGPRALGARSIIANPLHRDMQSKINLKIKYRESFRPFAPIYMEERTSDYFDFDRPSPHMLIVRNVKEQLLTKADFLEGEEDMLKIINQVRSEIPAITHVDNSARLQSVNRKQNEHFYDILSAFEKITGKGILVNTSFNVRGEPIVCTPEDAYRCFMRTEMDVLVLGDFLLYKHEQPEFIESEDWRETFVLD
jgi:carbamoyltransferase